MKTYIKYIVILSCNIILYPEYLEDFRVRNTSLTIPNLVLQCHNLNNVNLRLKENGEKDLI